MSGGRAEKATPEKIFEIFQNKRARKSETDPTIPR
jgi:hypothetical protein